jgi:hypothetical protein
MAPPSSYTDTSYTDTSHSNSDSIISYAGTSCIGPSVIITCAGTYCTDPSFGVSHMISPLTGSAGIRCGGDTERVANQQMIGAAEV